MKSTEGLKTEIMSSLNIFDRNCEIYNPPIFTISNKGPKEDSLEELVLSCFAEEVGFENEKAYSFTKVIIETALYNLDDFDEKDQIILKKISILLCCQWYGDCNKILNELLENNNIKLTDQLKFEIDSEGNVTGYYVGNFFDFIVNTDHKDHLSNLEYGFGAPEYDKIDPIIELIRLNKNNNIKNKIIFFENKITEDLKDLDKTEPSRLQLYKELCSYYECKEIELILDQIAPKFESKNNFKL